MPQKKALITGGAGFIGAHTAAGLVKSGYQVKILDNLEPPVHNRLWPKSVRDKGYELVRGDVRKKSDWRRALKDVSIVFHLAAYQDQRPDFSKFFEVNTAGTARMYEVIAEENLPIRKIVTASSQFVYGDGRYTCAHPPREFFPELRPLDKFQNQQFDILCPHGGRATFHPFREDQSLTPTNSYGLSKQALENLSLRLGKTHGIPTTVLRYSIVQGPGQSPRNLYSGALRIFVTQALAGRPITVHEDGKQKRDFVNIEDVVGANLMAVRDKRTNFEIYNVGGGKGYSVMDFAKLVKKTTNSVSPIVLESFRRTDTRHAVSDIRKIGRIGWYPRFTPEKSVQDYANWIKAEFE